MPQIPLWELALIVAVVAVIFAWFGWFLSRRIGQSKLSRADEVSKQIIRDAEKEAEIKKKEAILEAKDEWYKAKLAFEREIQNKKMDLQKLEL